MEVDRSGRCIVGEVFMRLFIAIQLAETLKDSIRDVQDEFREQGVKGNFTSYENMHLTLAFIGEYGDPDMVLETMEKVSFNTFEMKMNMVGHFSDLWWAGVSEYRQVSDLVRSLRHRLAEAGIPFDKKRFMPHITFLRKPVYTGSTELRTNIVPAVMTVDRISLIRSDRGRNGMIYTEIGSVLAQG